MDSLSSLALELILDGEDTCYIVAFHNYVKVILCIVCSFCLLGKLTTTALSLRFICSFLNVLLCSG